jgi:Flp pilus assembly pilin Flp
MASAFVTITRLVHRNDGQDLLEYGFVMALIALGAMLAVGSLGNVLNSLWWGPIAGAL